MSWNITPVLAHDGNHECGNCGKVWPHDQLNDIKDLGERIFAGETVPSGECPECGALCHPVKKKPQ